MRWIMGRFQERACTSLWAWGQLQFGPHTYFHCCLVIAFNYLKSFRWLVRGHQVYQAENIKNRAMLLVFYRLLHVRNGNCKYHLGEETFKLAQTYMDKLSKHGQQANKAALYGELCALLFAKSHYDEVSVLRYISLWPISTYKNRG